MSNDDSGSGADSGTEESRPDREEFRHDPVDHAAVEAGMSVADLIGQYGRAGIGAASVHEAVDVTAAMFREDVTCFMGLAGAMVPTGMRAVVADLIRDGHVDALVTTGANLTHDAIEAIGGKHHHGEVHAEGRTEREHDERLRDEGVDAFVTGEGKGKLYHEAREAGVHVYLAGHYATETFGVRALAELVESWGLATTFVDHPTGL